MVKLLIIYPGALGDILLTRPIIFFLKKQFPNCQIEYVGNLEYLQLLNTETTKIYDFFSSKLLSLFSQKPELDQECRLWLESYNYIIFWSTLTDPLVKTKLSSLKNTKFVYQSIKPPVDYKKHQTGLSLKSLEPFGISPKKNIPEIISEMAFTQTAEKENLIITHPGSGGKEKNLPMKIYKQTRETILEKTDFKIIFIIGPAEKQYLKELQNEDLDFVFPENVMYLKEILSKSKYYIGNDSGVTHLAAQLGIPTLAIFISTNPIVWAPFGKEVFIIHNQKSIKSRFHFVEKLTSKELSNYFLEEVFVG